MYRVYTKPIAGANPNLPTNYTSDGTGALCEICVKQFTLVGGVAQNNIAVIGIVDPKVKIQTFTVLSLKTADGLPYVPAGAGTTYVLANNVLTITVANDSTAIAANAVLQVMYTVGA